MENKFSLSKEKNNKLEIKSTIPLEVPHRGDKNSDNFSQDRKPDKLGIFLAGRFE